MRVILAQVIAVLCISVGSFVLGQSMDDAYRLHQHLLVEANYSKHIRPATDQSKSTYVNITFDLVSLRELDEIVGKISIVGIIWLVWYDPRLRWNPADYGGITNTKLEMREVWKPDLVIAHPIESVSSIGFDHHHYPVRFFANGVGLWAPGDVMTTTCKIDVAYYPFDTQICEVIFMHWGSRQEEVMLKAAQREISTKFFVGNGEWDLTNCYASEGMLDIVYPTYNVVLELKRRPTFIIVNVVLPILFMGLLNVLVFFLPAQSGERVSFSMTVLLAIAVFLTLVGDNMPKTSEPMSTICYFLLTNLVMSSIIMIVTILNLNIYHKPSTERVPDRLAGVVHLLCRRRSKRKKKNMVEDIAITDIDDADVDFKKKKIDIDIESKLAALDPPEPQPDVTWQEVSRMFDKIFGILALVWLFFSAAAFFGMVANQTVPGINSEG